MLITVRKCARQVERDHTARRNVEIEVSLQPASDDSATDWEPMAREPTVAQAAILAETVERLMARLDDRERQIVALSLQGCTSQEISAEVGRTERTGRRVLERVARWLEEVRDGDLRHKTASEA